MRQLSVPRPCAGGSSTQNRLGLSAPDSVTGDRHKRIAADPAVIDQLLADLFLDMLATLRAPRLRLILTEGFVCNAPYTSRLFGEFRWMLFDAG